MQNSHITLLLTPCSLPAGSNQKSYVTALHYTLFCSVSPAFSYSCVFLILIRLTPIHEHYFICLLKAVLLTANLVLVNVCGAAGDRKHRGARFVHICTLVCAAAFLHLLHEPSTCCKLLYI